MLFMNHALDYWINFQINHTMEYGMFVLLIGRQNQNLRNEQLHG